MKGTGAKLRGPGPTQTGNSREPGADGTKPRLSHLNLRGGARCPGGLRQLGETPILLPKEGCGASSGWPPRCREQSLGHRSMAVNLNSRDPRGPR